MTRIGRIFKKKREKLGLTQKDVATHLGWNTAQQVSNYERGICLPPSDAIKGIADLLKIDSKSIWDCLESDLKEKFLERMKCMD